MPENMNDITIANFSESYNKIQKNYASDISIYLSETVEYIEDMGNNIVNEVNKLEGPKFIFTQEMV